jgi:hypothetical protein
MATTWPIGMAKPIFDACALIAVVIPTTWPRLLINGPPLLPKLIAASVWMNASRL